MRREEMKVSKTREFVFSLSMAFAMSFCMEYYNLSLNNGGANYGLVLDVLKEVWWITIIVFSFKNSSVDQLQFA